MNSLKSRIIIAITGIIVTGCQLPAPVIVPTITPGTTPIAQSTIIIPTLPTPTPLIADRCFGFNPDVDNIVSRNYCLQSPFSSGYTIGIVQDTPQYFFVENILKNADGYRDNYTYPARIVCTSNACTINLHNSRTGIDGCWGYSQVMYLDAGNYMIKIAGHSWINDPLASHALNYSVRFEVNNRIAGQSQLPTFADYEIITSFVQGANGSSEVSVYICAGYATAGIDSYVDITGIGIIRIQD